MSGHFVTNASAGVLLGRARQVARGLSEGLDFHRPVIHLVNLEVWQRTGSVANNKHHLSTSGNDFVRLLASDRAAGLYTQLKTVQYS